MFLVAPSSTDERVAKIARACRGFVYAASLMGITGTRDAVSTDASGLVKRIREHTDLPVAVGLGVSNGVQAAQVAAFADGVIVGSAFVRRLLDDQGVPAIRELDCRTRRRRPPPRTVTALGWAPLRPSAATPARRRSVQDSRRHTRNIYLIRAIVRSPER